MSRVPQEYSKQLAFLDLVQHMLAERVIKVSGILLQPFIRFTRFKMESLRSVVAAMNPYEYMTAVDIKDAYLHIPIFQPHQRFLRFAFKNQHYQFQALPFGLTTAPRIFTKVMAAVTADLRQQALFVTPYLDDILIKAPSRAVAQSSLDTVLRTLSDLGWTINYSKSTLSPTQRITFLGMTFDTRIQRVFLPPEKISPVTSAFCQICHEDPGVNGRLHRGSPILSIPPQRTSMEYPGPMDVQIPNAANCPTPQNQSVPPLVAQLYTFIDRQVPDRPPLDYLDDGCQSPRMGGSPPDTNSTRPLVSCGDTAPNKHLGNQGGQPGTPTLAEPAPRTGDQGAIRQRYHGSVPESPGGHQEPRGTKGGRPNTVLGRSPQRHPVLNIHPGSRKLAGRLSQSTNCRPGRVVLETPSLSEHYTKVGSTKRRPHGLTAQPQSGHLHGTMQGPTSHSSGRHDNPLGLPPLLRVPTLPSTTQGHQKDQKGTLHSDTHSSALAQTGLVLGLSQPEQREHLATTTNTGPALAGPYPAPQPGSTTFGGVATESLILLRKGFSPNVIHTMIAARKTVSAKSYHRIWKRYKEWCDQGHLPWDQFSLVSLLEFLQSGMTKGLSLASLKSQISALSVLFQTKIAEIQDVRTFLQGVAHIVPPYRAPTPSWDLNLVLRSLQEAPFEPLATIPLLWLTWKTIFLVAIASARRVSELSALSCQRPFLTFHNDRAVLRTVPTFLLKVVTKFHLNQEITLPTFCPQPQNPKEKALHSLDPVRALKFYLERTNHIRTTQSLFILPRGPHKGSPASKVTISRWIKEAIRRAYLAKGKPSPLQVRAHSTRAVSTSWAFRNRASAEQLCKAATWSSIHSFTKFYNFEVFAADSAHFGRKVLQAAVAHK
eukprot:XP_012815376.1 PREDICTED: uncharacterized protein LOC105946832 [Xenopus tropicalis]